LTAGTDGCTEFFSEVETVAFDPVSVNDLTGPVTFVGIAKVLVFVTSPLTFVVTPGREVGDGEGEALAEADAVGEGDGVALALTVGVGVGVAATDGEGEGVGVGEIEGVGPGPTPPPELPPPPPPPPPESGVGAARIEKSRVTDVAAA
jgi:hypothetical protein